MKTIAQFPIVVCSEQKIKMPKGAKILSVHVLESPLPFLFAEVDQDAEPVDRLIATYGAGHQMIVREACRYVGSYLISEMNAVYHVYSD